MTLTDIPAMLFWSAQGAVIVAGAWAGVAITGRKGALAKIGATAIAYLAWMLATSLVYGRLGAGSPLLVADGAFLVGLFLTALASATAWLLLWLLWPSREAARLRGAAAPAP